VRKHIVVVKSVIARVTRRLIVNSLRLHVDENEANFSSALLWRNGELKVNLQGNRTAPGKFEKAISPLSRHEMRAWQTNFCWIGSAPSISFK